jgi:hypothetical protein
MEELISNFRESIDGKDIEQIFSLSEDESPLWAGKPSFPSFLSRYFLAFFVFLIHFLFYYVAVTNAAEGEEGYFGVLIRVLDMLFDAIDIFAFIFVMLIFARFNYYLNIGTSNKKITIYLLLIGLMPSIWYIINIIDWLLWILGKDDLGIPEWLDSWFLVLGVLHGVILFISAMIYQFSFYYLMTDKNLYFRTRTLIFFKSQKNIGFGQLENLKTNRTLLGRIFRFGDILPILKDEQAVHSESSAALSEPSLLSKFFHLLIFKKRKRKNDFFSPSECFSGIRNHMDVYDLANELIDLRDGRPDLANETEYST